jgi:hypothetical protein
LHRAVEQAAFGIDVVAPDFQAGEVGPVRLRLRPMRSGSAAVAGVADSDSAAAVASTAAANARIFDKRMVIVSPVLLLVRRSGLPASLAGLAKDGKRLPSRWQDGIVRPIMLTKKWGGRP